MRWNLPCWERSDVHNALFTGLKEALIRRVCWVFVPLGHAGVYLALDIPIGARIIVLQENALEAAA